MAMPCDEIRSVRIFRRRATFLKNRAYVRDTAVCSLPLSGPGLCYGCSRALLYISARAGVLVGVLAARMQPLRATWLAAACCTLIVAPGSARHARKKQRATDEGSLAEAAHLAMQVRRRARCRCTQA